MKYKNNIMNYFYKLLIFFFIDVFMVIFMVNYVTIGQEKFNTFKSYSNKKIKPNNYSKKNLRHEIQEYLDENQLKMLKKRKGKDDIVDMFDNKWSGFNNKNK